MSDVKNKVDININLVQKETDSFAFEIFFFKQQLTFQICTNKIKRYFGFLQSLQLCVRHQSLDRFAINYLKYIHTL